MFLLIIHSLSIESLPYMEQQAGIISNSAVTKNKNCKAPHTRKVKNQIGKCECEPGYPSGDPELSTGCFRCKHNCVENAMCSFPGKCVCKPGYDGDGINKCSIIAPVFLSIQPDNAFAYKEFISNVTCQSIPNANFSKAYLKIKDTVHVCHLIKDSMYNCTIKRMPGPGTIELSLSFDNSTWSKEFIEFQIFSPEIGDALMYIFILMIISGVAVGIFRTKRKVKTIDPQNVPFLSSK